MNDISKKDLVILKDNLNLVQENINYLLSIGIEKPEIILKIRPELFYNNNKLIRKIFKDVDIDAVNYDPLTILEYI